MARDDPTGTTVLLEVWRVARRVQGVLDRALAGTPLTPGDFGLYSLLWLEAPLTPTEVSRRSGSPATTTSQALARAQDRGHLRRDPHPDDARSSLVALTDTGLAAHRATAEAFRPVLDEVNQRLGDDLPQVIFSLVQLDAVLRAAGEQGDDAVRRPQRPPGAVAHDLRYTGDALTASEEAEAVAFIDWLRHRRRA